MKQGGDAEAGGSGELGHKDTTGKAEAHHDSRSAPTNDCVPTTPTFSSLPTCLLDRPCMADLLRLLAFYASALGLADEELTLDFSAAAGNLTPLARLRLRGDYSSGEDEKENRHFVPLGPRAGTCIAASTPWGVRETWLKRPGELSVCRALPAQDKCADGSKHPKFDILVNLSQMPRKLRWMSSKKEKRGKTQCTFAFRELQVPRL